MDVKFQELSLDEVISQVTIIPERVDTFDLNIGEGNTIRAVNGEYIFGPSETWPAQLQDFSGYVAEKTKDGSISVDKNTFTDTRILDLLKIHRPSIFDRSYLSKEEASSTFDKVALYLQAGIALGLVELEIKQKFDALSPLKKKYFQFNEGAGKKFIDKLCDSTSIRKKMSYIDSQILDYAPLHPYKYEVLKRK